MDTVPNMAAVMRDRTVEGGGEEGLFPVAIPLTIPTVVVLEEQQEEGTMNRSTMVLATRVGIPLLHQELETKVSLHTLPSGHHSQLGVVGLEHQRRNTVFV